MITIRIKGFMIRKYYDMKIIFCLPLCLLVLASCSSKGGDAEPTPDGLAATNCFKAFDYRYENILTKADILKHTTIDEPSFEQEVSSIKGEYGSCTYKWESGRTRQMELLGQLITAPDPNMVGMKLLSFYTVDDLRKYNQQSITELFEIGYRALSEEEYQQMVTNLEKEYAGNPEGLATAKKLLEARMSSNYTPVNGLGDSAFWSWHDMWGIELAVLVGATKFVIVTKVSTESKASLDLAIAAAKEVISKCEQNR